MLSTGYHAVSSACLRCQLRSTIFGRACPNPTRCLDISRACHRRGYRVSIPYRQRESQADENAEDSLLSKDSVYEQSGYVAGRRRRFQNGRRQWEESARLQATAMGKPFEVTVMHDIPEQVEGQHWDRWPGVSGNEPREEGNPRLPKEAILLGSKPSDEEVVASIDALRPETTFLAAQELTVLGDTLSHRYNTKQLSIYLQHVLKVPSNEAKPRALGKKRSDEIRRSVWKAGRTDIKQRLGHAKEGRKVDTGKSKKSIVHRLIRLAWGLRSNEEAQYLGELELMLPSWQFSYLFSLSADGTPLYKSLIDTAFLRKSSQIQPYQRDNVMRIIGRQGDAVEIADQIQRNLSNTISLKTDMMPFRDLFSKDRFEAGLEELLSPSMCAEVGRHTNTFAELRGAELGIYGKTDHDVQAANRILLSLLPLPSRKVVKTLSPVFLDALQHPTERFEKVLLSFEHEDSELALRHRDLKLGRLVMSSEVGYKVAQQRRKTIFRPSHLAPSISSGFVRTVARRLAENLDRYPLHLSLQNNDPNVPPPWGRFPDAYLATSRWHIEIGGLVLPDRADEYDAVPAIKGQAGIEQRSNSANSADQLLLRSRIPNMADFLSYYTPIGQRHEREAFPHRILVAHFMPSPFSKDGLGLLHRLPRIEVVYDTANHSSPLRRITATMAKETVRLPLPGEAVDLCFVRNIVATAEPVEMMTDSLSQFTETLLTSPTRGLDTLRAEDEVLMKLPTSWLAGSHFQKSAEKDGLSLVPYQFDRFEVRQMSTFVPAAGEQDAWVNDDSMQHILKDKAIRLHYQEANGGIIGGSRKELRIASDARSGTTEEPNPKQESPQFQDLLQLVDHGLHIARAFTRLGSGELKAAWEYDGWRKRPRAQSKDGVDVEEME